MIRPCIRQAARVFAGAAIFICATAAHSTSFQMNCDSLTLSGTPPNQILTCNIGSAPPSGCSIQGPTTGLIGTPTSLTAVCTGGTTPFTYAWSGGSAANCGNAQACSVSDAATTTYSVAISNAQGVFTPSPTKTIAWSNTPIGPSGCAGSPSTSSLPVGGGSVSVSMDCAQGSGLAIPGPVASRPRRPSRSADRSRPPQRLPRQPAMPEARRRRARRLRSLPVAAAARSPARAS